MNPGKLNQRIRIERQSSTQDAAGQQLRDWDLVAVVWAEVRYQSGAEAMRANAVTSVVNVNIRVRYRNDIAACMRVLHGAKTYSIAAVLPDMSRKEYLDLVCDVLP